MIAYRVSLAEMRAIRANAKAKKEKREEKAKDLWPKRTGKRTPDRRKAAFKRLKNLCREYVLLRAKHRTGGSCEVGVTCGGLGYIEVPYHVFPAKLGNRLKYDERNILGACSRCNGGEYFARKRGSSVYIMRHREILGDKLFDILDTEKGRMSISTAAAIEMGDRFQSMIEKGMWRIVGA